MKTNLHHKTRKHGSLFIILFLIIIFFIYIEFRLMHKHRDSFLNQYFVDVASQAGVNWHDSAIEYEEKNFDGFDAISYVRSGIAWGDYNNDGCVDLFVANPGGTNKLYKNDCFGHFIDVASEAGVAYKGKSMAAAFGDYDKDGCLDLYVANKNDGNILYHNNCHGLFVNVTSESGIEKNEKNVVPGSVSWVDYNNDGNLDIYVANSFYGDRVDAPLSKDRTMNTRYIFYSKRNYLFKNNGDGTFSEVATKAGIAGPERRIDFLAERTKRSMHDTGFAYTSLWFDYNRDGCIDLYIASDGGYNPLYKNNCNGTFTNVTHQVGLDNLFLDSMSASSADVNHDGYPDIYVGNDSTDRLYINHGGKYFTEEALQRGITPESDMLNKAILLRLSDIDGQFGWGTVFFDHNNSGNQDIYVVNDGLYIDAGARAEDRFYINNNGHFTEITKEAGLFEKLRGIAVAKADYNNDGLEDFYVANSNGPNYLYKNVNREKNHWLTLHLRGATSNILGIGAEVSIVADHGNFKRTAQMTSGGTYLSQNEYTIHFGLNKNSMINLLTIRWPSGIVQTVKNISTDRKLIIHEAR